MITNMSIPDGVSLEIICVVDGSTDNTLEMLRMLYPNIHLVIGNGNWWYTKSMNAGFKFAERLHPDLILTLNDDIILPTNYLQNLIRAYNLKSSDSIIGSVSFTHKKPHRIITSGVKSWNKFLDKTYCYFPFLAQIEPSSISGTFVTPMLPGRGMLIPWHVLKFLNFFDENFAQYQSDFDFTLRATKAGFPVYISWDAKVFSLIERTSSGSSFLKSSWKTLLRDFFNPYSRRYIPNRSRYYWRHYFKMLWPWYMTKFLLLSFKNFFFKKKIG